MKVFLIIYLFFVSFIFNFIQKEKSFEESISDGKLIYEDFCIQCHLFNGEGIEKIYPPLNNSDYLLKNLDKSIYSIKYGLTGEIIVNGIKYNVNCIKDWDARNDLVTICPNETQMLVFSSFLIHGLAQNLHHDTTRISLEFRLFG